MGTFPSRVLWTWVVLLVVVLSCSFQEGVAVVAGYAKPTSCSTHQCPSYQVVHSQDDFEIRSYDKAMWVAAPPINSTSYKEASRLGFLRLLSYIKGRNEQGVKMEMTAPVMIDITRSTGPFSNFVVRFYVTREHQNAPPHSDQVRPEMWPGPRYAAVRRFGGFLNDSNIPTEASALSSSLRGTPWEAAADAAAGGRGGPSRYTVAGYNSPFNLKDRVNEVFFPFG